MTTHDDPISARISRPPVQLLMNDIKHVFQDIPVNLRLIVGYVDTVSSFSVWRLQRRCVENIIPMTTFGLPLPFAFTCCDMASLGPSSSFVAIVSSCTGAIYVADILGGFEGRPEVCVEVAAPGYCMPKDIAATETTLLVLCEAVTFVQVRFDMYTRTSVESNEWVLARSIQAPSPGTRLLGGNGMGLCLAHMLSTPRTPRINELFTIRVADGEGAVLVGRVANIPDPFLPGVYIGPGKGPTAMSLLDRIVVFDGYGCPFDPKPALRSWTDQEPLGTKCCVGNITAMALIPGAGFLVCGRKGFVIYQNDAEAAMWAMSDARVDWMCAVFRSSDFYVKRSSSLFPKQDAFVPKRHCCLQSL